MSDYNAKVRIKQGGAELECDSGGVITILSGGIINLKTGAIVQTNGAQATITALTDNSAGTANNTIQAIPDPADSPATADALRDGLVANVLPAIRNNTADNAGKINEIITILKNAGLAV
ncbi:MAG: hypothetical protein IT435_05595 [Phycisphaerales bacterium]|nr:hypothetical protein [Phycisphaerales bacterium]